ncbi:hypothetical protein [Aminobacter aminovorans]|jgi:hypothetical protein|uniref:hypothetical protein n=1 Tax=Aminobacter aminovorans TaxID=83263 RepID=UPI001405130D|nr:hypothetical protein [Aminobacter aminovorans]
MKVAIANWMMVDQSGMKDIVGPPDLPEGQGLQGDFRQQPYPHPIIASTGK